MPAERRCQQDLAKSLLEMWKFRKTNKSPQTRSPHGPSMLSVGGWCPLHLAESGAAAAPERGTVSWWDGSGHPSNHAESKNALMSETEQAEEKTTESNPCE